MKPLPNLVHQKQSVDDLITRALDLAENQYNCSQILMKLTLEKEGVNNPDLVRSVSGIGEGCGFRKGTCGVLTGAACVLAWYSGKHIGNDERPETLLPMLEELNLWFEEKINGNYPGNRCEDIVSDLSGIEEKKMVCGPLLLEAYLKSHDILGQYGLA